jgi:tRNA(Ile)-lysidine synthase
LPQELILSGDLTKTILSTIARYHMVRAGDRVGVAVSGGSDSVALLRILHALREQQGILLSVVHFNHSLRGADSDEDERFVAELAEQLGLPLISGREDVAAISRAKRWNLEDGARRLRYGFFASLVKEGRIDLVAVGHTADDQAETVLARLARGTAPAGLSAIYPVKGHVIRPFIDVRRADLRKHLHGHGQRWREDATNCDASRLRSRLRQRVLPMLESEIQPAIVGNLGRLAARSREDEAFWRALTAGLLETSVREDGGRISIHCGDLLGLRPLPNTKLSDEARLAIARRLVRGIVEKVRGDCRQWTTDHVERVIWLASEGTSGSRVELPGVIAERSFDWVWFSPAEEWRRGDAEGSAHGGSEQAFWQVVEVGNPGESTVIAVPEIRRRFQLKVVDWHAWRRDTESDKYAIDRDLLGSPLVLRNWRSGDSFRPKGRRSAHKLKHLLRVGRVRASARGGWPVLTSASLLVWARGLPVAAEVATGPATRSGVVITEEDL